MHQKYKPRPEDFTIRPLFRVLGALMTTFMAYILVIGAIPLFLIKELQLKECRQLKGRLMCEVGNWFASKVPSNFQGPAEAIARLLFAGIMLYLTWRLLKPLIVNLQTVVNSKRG